MEGKNMSFLHQLMFRILRSGKKDYDPNNLPDFVSQRAGEQKIAKRIKAPVCLTIIQENGIQGELLSLEGKDPDRVIYYIHGGGFVAGSAEGRRGITAWLVRHSGCDVFSINYRLAPEDPFPFGAQDCLKGYEMLLSRYSADHICFMGDSAGANLVLSTVMQAQDKGLPLPACVVPISPVVQFERELLSYTANADTDCMIAGNILQEFRDLYLQREENWSHPYATVLNADLHQFPPTYLVASEIECLRDDAVAFHQALLQAGRNSHLEMYPDLIHAFPILTMFPESKQALRKIVSFIETHLQPAADGNPYA